MEWYSNLYLGEGLESKADQIINKIKKNQLTPEIYLIAFSSNPDNLLDIIPSWELMQKGYPKGKMKVIGLAKGKMQALELVRYIVDETYQNTGTADVLGYINQKMEEQL